MDIREKQEITQSLQAGRDALIQAILGVSEEHAQQKTDAGRWSILECMEHIVAAEDYMFRQIQSATKLDVPQLNKGREALIRKRGADRSHKVEAPEAARPAGRFKTLDEATRHFLLSRQCTLDFVMSCSEDLRGMTATHPLMGPVNCYEMLLIMSAHPFRHAQQIEELRNHPSPNGRRCPEGTDEGYLT